MECIAGCFGPFFLPFVLHQCLLLNDTPRCTMSLLLNLVKKPHILTPRKGMIFCMPRSLPGVRGRRSAGRSCKWELATHRASAFTSSSIQMGTANMSLKVVQGPPLLLGRLAKTFLKLKENLPRLFQAAVLAAGRHMIEKSKASGSKRINKLLHHLHPRIL